MSNIPSLFRIFVFYFVAIFAILKESKSVLNGSKRVLFKSVKAICLNDFLSIFTVNPVNKPKLLRLPSIDLRTSLYRANTGSPEILAQCIYKFKFSDFDLWEFPSGGCWLNGLSTQDIHTTITRTHKYSSFDTRWNKTILFKQNYRNS